MIEAGIPAQRQSFTLYTQGEADLSGVGGYSRELVDVA
jgi:hypothetical protein